MMRIQIVLSIFTAFVESLFYSGVFYGLPSLQYVLENEGYFGYLCQNNTANTPSFLRKNSTNIENSTCGAQEASYNLVFTLGVSLMFILAFGSGYVLDKFGTWIYRTIMTTLFTLGYALLAISSPSTSVLLYPALIFIAISGFGLHTSNFQVANFVTPLRGLIMSLIHGLFDSSVLVFLLVKKSYDSGIDLQMVLRFMTCISVYLWLRTYLLLPKKHIPFPLHSKDIQFGWKELPWCENTHEQQNSLELQSSSIEVQKSENGRSSEGLEKITYKSTLRNILFWTNMLHYSVIALRTAFLPSSMLSWLRTFSHPNDISELIDDFGFISSFGAFASFFSGLIIDVIRKLMMKKTKNKEVLHLTSSMFPLLITSLLCIMLSIAVLISSAYSSFVLYVLTRGFVHATNTAFIAFNFPFEHFGKLYGLVSVVAGLVGLLQYAIFQISLHLDPTYYYINVGFLISSILTLGHPIAITLSIKKKAQTLHRTNDVAL